MELHPLPLPDLQLATVRGNTRHLARGPRSLQEILAEASAAMDAEDAYQCWLRGEPVPMMRHPRRKLRRLLFGR